MTSKNSLDSPVFLCYSLFRYLEKHLNKTEFSQKNGTFQRKGVISMGFQDSFKALSDPTRREILNLLRAGPLAAGAILEHFPITGASLSHHLSILKHAGLIDDEKKGKYIYYTLNTTVLDDILNWMLSLKGMEKGETDHEKS